MLKYQSTKYVQSTLSETQLITICLASVNHTDMHIGDYKRATVEEKKKLKEERLKDDKEYDEACMQKHFGVSCYEDLA